nr:MAG TPA: hypothetical protein [Caudoviricetes sp.]
MEDLPIGSEIVLKVIESEKEECNGCFFDEICSDIYNVICGDFKCVAIGQKRRKECSIHKSKMIWKQK